VRYFSWMNKVLVENKQRLMVLDVLRGLFVVGLIIIHLRLYPNLLLTISGRSKLWLSVGEGFFAVSGFLLGYLNRYSWFVDPIVSSKKLWKRSFKLYLWSIFTTLFFTIWGNLFPVGLVKESLWQITSSNIGEMIMKTLSFRYVYGWADYLVFYTIYIFLTPLVLWLAARHKAWKIVAISLFIWLVRNNNLYMGMQVVFFMSLLVGFRYIELEKAFAKIDYQKIKKLQNLVMMIFWGTLIFSIVSVHYFFVIKSLMQWFGVSDEVVSFVAQKNLVLNLYFDKQTMGLGRLVLYPLWFLGVLSIVNRFKSTLAKLFGGIFLDFGKNSLKVYIIHAFVIFPVPWLSSKFGISGYSEYTLFTFLVLIIIYYINKYSENIKI